MRFEIKSVATLALGASLFGVTSYFLYLLLKNEDEYEFTESVSMNKKLDIKIPKKFIRALIGRNGTNIREIEVKTNTKIRFNDAQENEEHRICIIRGKDIADCRQAESLIRQFIAQQPDIESDEFLVPNIAIGRVIGRNGNQINYITEMSGAKIRVSDSFDSSDKKVVLRGTRDQIQTAKSYITEIVNDDAQRRLKLEEKLAQREPRGKARTDTNGKTNEDDLKQSSEKLTNNALGGDGQMEVYVSAVIDPSQFWLQIVGPKANELDQLVEEMTDYYSKVENQELHTLQTEPDVGDIVAAVFMCDGKWYRAEVIEIRSEDNGKKCAQLYYLDYGDTDSVAIDELYELRTDFLRLRFQAIECFLARVKPIGEEWSEEAIDRFEEWVQVAQWKKLRARVSNYKDRPKREGSPIPGVDLYDVNNQEDLDIAEKLVKNGYAVFESNEHLTNSEHLLTN